MESRKFIRLIWIIGVFQLQILNGLCQNLSDDHNKIRTVVLDAGHGGKDPGAKGTKVFEKDIVLAVTLKAGKYIEERIPGVKVIYTRTTDVFVPLHERAEIANKADADLFISVHANSNPNTNPYGTETFAMGLHKSESNFDVAKKENSVIVFEDDYKAKYEGFDPNDIESYIMISVAQDIYLEQSLVAAQFVQDQFRDRAKRKDRGVKQAGFLVLWQTSMPSILIETGFLSNENEEKYLMSDKGQDHLASAVYRAFRDYKFYIEGTSASNPLTKIGIEKTAENKTDTTKIPNKTTITPVKTVKKSEKVKKSSIVQKSNPIIDTSVVKFKVQILYSESQIELNNDLFKDFNDVEEIHSDGKYKYVVGSKGSYSEAIEYSKWVKNRHPDAFVVAISKGTIIPLSKALELEKSN